MGSNWRKSSYSADNGGACVEVASAEAVLVRDTTDREGPALTFTADAWRAFTKTVKLPRRRLIQLRRALSAPSDYSTSTY